MEVRVPDIGDFSEVPVVEVLVKPGDAVRANDSLVVLESDKASMEVPSPADGTVTALSVKAGDKVSQGSVILSIATEDAAAAPPAANAATPVAQATTPGADATAPVAKETAVEAPAAGATPASTDATSPQIVDIAVPDVGDFKDIPVIEVLIKPGDTIRANDSLVVLESDKASMEVPASAGGTVREVRVKPGDKVSQGSVIATVETVASAPAAAASAPAAGARTASAPSASSQSAVPPSAIAASASPPPAAEPPRDGSRVHASPSIRRFARELGVDLGRVRGSGPNGRITRENVQTFVKTALRDGVAAGGGAPGFSVAPWPKVDYAKYGPIERKPLSRIQRISGPALHRNWVTIPHVTQNEDADITDLEAFRKELNAQHVKDGVKITMLAFLIKATVAALKEHPQFNASLDGDELVLKQYYNIGFAADTPDGLVVPVIKDADCKGALDIARETAELAAKARDGKISMSDMQGGTFTISSLGGIGGTYFTPIVNAPEVAILGVCKSAMRPVWDGKQFVPRLMLPLSLSYDHRVIDGAAAARFNVYLAALLADIRRAML